MRRTELAQRVLVPAAVGCWLAVVLLVSTFLSWWLFLVLLVVAAASGPLLLRRWRRWLRLASLRAGSVADGWAEILDESADRGVAVPEQDTVRAMAGTIANDHGFDAEGRTQIRTVVSELERSWYAPTDRHSGEADKAVAAVLDALRQATPISLRDRYWPRSVLTRPRATHQDADHEPARR